MRNRRLLLGACVLVDGDRSPSPRWGRLRGNSGLGTKLSDTKFHPV